LGIPRRENQDDIESAAPGWMMPWAKDRAAWQHAPSAGPFFTTPGSPFRDEPLDERWIEMPTPLDLYRVTGKAGNVGTPGAPILHFDLLVNSSEGSISGQAHINQAVAPPGGEIHIHNVSGTVRELVSAAKSP
jgi:hypothetical protein